MSRKTNEPSQVIHEGVGSSRRDLLKGALAVLGAGVLIQPNGGVSGVAFADTPQPPAELRIKPAAGQTLLKYMQSIAGSKILLGQHADFYSGASLANAYDQLGGTTAATINIPIYGGGSTGQAPAILGVAMGNGTPGAIAGASGTYSTVYGGSGIKMNGLGTAQDWVSTNPAGIVAVSAWFMDPATNKLTTSPNVASILTTGSSLQTAFYAYVDSFASLVKQIPATVLLRPFVEFNGNWETFGASSATPAQRAALFQLVRARMTADGVTNVLYVWNVNDLVGDTESLANTEASYPGSAYVDVVSWDIYSPIPGTSAVRTGLYAYLETLGKPIIVFEAGARVNNSAGPYTFLTDLITNCPQVCAIIYWCQGWALSGQPGSSQVVSASQIICRSALPSWL